MNVDSKLLRMLLEIAFVATQNRQFAEAETIFEAVLQYRPDSIFPIIGKACINLHKGEYESAIKLLDSASGMDSEEKELCNGLLGVAFKLAGYNEHSSELLNEIKENGNYNIAVELASETLKRDFTRF